MDTLVEREYWCVLGYPQRPKIYAHEGCPRSCKYRKEADESEKWSRKLGTFYPSYIIKIGQGRGTENGDSLFVLFVLEEKFGLELEKGAQVHKNNLRRIGKAQEECWFIRNHFHHQDDSIDIEMFLFRMRGYRQKTFVRVSDPHSQTEHEAYVPKEDIFGPRTLSSLEAEIRVRISRGQKLNKKTLNELKQKFQYKGRIDPRIIGYIWSSVRKEIQPFQRLTPRELEAERNWETLSDLLPRDAMQTSRVYERKFKRNSYTWRTLPERAALDFLAPYYTDALTLLNQGRVLETPSASYRVVPPQAVKKAFPERPTFPKNKRA